MSTNRFVAFALATLLAMLQPATTANAQGPQIGIKVHGHWVIDVRNPDGTLAQHLDFENALTSTGAQALADILTQRTTVGLWSVAIDGGATIALGAPSTPPGPCAQQTLLGNSTICLFAQNQTSQPGLGPLAVSEAGSAVQLTGTVQALSDGTIGVVATLLNTSAGGAIFSSANPTPTSTVRANQVISVNVTLSFS